MPLMRSTDVVAPHPLSEAICFHAPPERVLAAASSGGALPAVSQAEHWILVAPRLPNLARGCSGGEARLFQSLRTSPALAAHLRSDGDMAQALESLWHAGALRRH
jgi:hypothetical protein